MKFQTPHPDRPLSPSAAPLAVHWAVRMSHRNRPVGFLMLLAIVLVHMFQLGWSWPGMLLAVLQFGVYPQLVYWYAARSAHGLRAEIMVMRLDAALFGFWVAALGFPSWIGYVFFIAVVLNLTLFNGFRGGLEAAVLFLGAALLLLLGRQGIHAQPDTGWVVTFMCMAALTFYLLLLADAAYSRTRRLHETREQLRNRESELSRQLEDNHRLQRQLMDKVNRDALTGLFNRHYLEAALQGEAARCDREGQPISLLMLDLDHFKKINDRYGHPAGDEVLRGLAGLIQAVFRGSDIPCRYGGEEFLVLMPGATLGSAARRAEKLRQAFSELEIRVRGRALRATLSVGVAEWGVSGVDSIAKFVAAADLALYQAKVQGRNRVVTSEAPQPSAWDQLVTMPGVLTDRNY